MLVISLALVSTPAVLMVDAALLLARHSAGARLVIENPAYKALTDGHGSD